MFGWGKKSDSASDALTFKSRIQEFWLWFNANAEKFHAKVSSNASDEIVPEVEETMNELMPDLAWVFGPGDGDNKHSFTLTGEGAMPKQLLAYQWFQQAPAIKGWTFFPAKQATNPENLKGIAIQLRGSKQLEAEKLTVATLFDEERNVFDITCSHPEFKGMPDQERNFLLMLLLDEALGEFGVVQYVGNIDFGPPPPNSKSMSIVEFPTFLEHARKYHNWEPRSIMNSYTLYELPHQNTKRPRADSIGGTSLVPDIVGEYIERGKPLKDNSLKNLGAEIAYLQFPTSNLDEEQLIDSRSKIEDAIHESLENQQSGRTLGGAIGTRNSYIDLLLIDGENSREIVMKCVKQFGLHGTVSIEKML